MATFQPDWLNPKWKDVEATASTAMATLQEFSPFLTSRPSIQMPLKELVAEVYGFFIQFDAKGVTKIENVTREAAREEPWYHVSRGVGLFWLLKGERVVYAAYCGGQDGKRVTAVRFQTNMRSSQWFGALVGLKHECTATEGRYIHSICPRRLGWYYSLLEAAVLPVVPPREDTVWFVNECVFTSGEEGDEFHSCASNVRAVLFDSSAVSATVLSVEQYERYVSLCDQVQLLPHEFVEELVQGEQIIGIDYTTERTALDEAECLVVSALRLVTTHRTTAWFGNPKSEEMSVTSGDQEGALICGFSGRTFTSGETIALGIVIATPRPMAPV